MKIVAVGETVFDILFRNNKPIDAVPGGSCFNSIVSVGRTGMPCQFVGYTGNDNIGEMTVEFLRENGVGTDYFVRHMDERSSLSLAFLNEKCDAEYVFYKEPPRAEEEEIAVPEFEVGDALLLGSYFAISPGTRSLIRRILEAAGRGGATIYYDLNFRRSHAHELERLMPAICENFRMSSIVRGSSEDFDIMYGTHDAQRIYDEHISRMCPVFICTAGAGKVEVLTPGGKYEFEVPQIPKEKIVSTVGAGDNFNAGLLCRMCEKGLKPELLERLPREGWEELVMSGVRFANAVCQSSTNNIPWGLK